MNAISSFIRPVAVVLLANLLVANFSSAQTARNPSTTPGLPSAGAVPEGESRYDIEIKDGELLGPGGKKTAATLENVVERLRELERSRIRNPANIVLSPDLPTIRIANLKLSSALLVQELEALRVASGERFVWTSDVGPQPIDPATGLPVDNIPVSPGMGPESERPLYILRPAPESDRNSLLRVEAFSLTGYFESKRKSNDEKEYRRMVDEEIELLRRIIKETVAVYEELDQQLNRSGGSSASSPSLRFHEGANLVIVTGEINGVEIAAKVITALPHVERSGSNLPGGFTGGGYGRGGGFPGPGPTGNPFGNRSRYGTAPQPGTGVGSDVQGAGAPPPR